MGANPYSEYRLFRFYEGMCSSADFPKELAKVLCLGVKSKPIYDSNNTILKDEQILKIKNWDIVYPRPSRDLGLSVNLAMLNGDEYFEKVDKLSPNERTAKINNQINQITDTVILRTVTTPISEIGEKDEISLDKEANLTERPMFLEIYKPTYLTNPEEFPLDCEREGVTPYLVTEDMWRRALKETYNNSINLYQDQSICTPNEERIDYDTQRKDINYVSTKNYVDRINAISLIHGININIPTDPTEASECLLTKEILSQIEQTDSVLYAFILQAFQQAHDGFSTNDYALLKTLRIKIIRQGTNLVSLDKETFAFQFSAVKVITVYTVNGTWRLQPGTSGYDKTTEKLIPELYLNGAYIPIDNKNEQYFSSEVNSITFNEFKFSQEDYPDTMKGLLVLRYSWQDAATNVIPERTTLLNNHYVLMRLFDNINAEMNGPDANIINASGEIIQTKSHASPWAKLSWYQDFHEVMLDTLDEDVSVSNISEGTVLVPLETVGLNSDTKIRYWINTNNDRFDLIVQGNPSLDYETERHLISACYCGRIDSFEDAEVNDTAGNFALFTSSSTEPTNTILNTVKTRYDILSYENLHNDHNNVDDIRVLMENNYAAGIQTCNTEGTYYVNLADNCYFIENQTPRFIIYTGNASTGYNVKKFDQVFSHEFKHEGSSSKSSTLQVDIPSSRSYEGATILILFGYYKEQYTIENGTTRDMFGNVLSVSKVNEYGKNTSDGVTSIMMYHTRSKAYYQKHHMLFATTEEYMSKILYGKSSYTNEYYADRIKVTHGNDGPRGILSDLLVIDNSSLYPNDELIINKDFKKDPNELEETFLYFPITAPYSPLSDSPNARYGLAIKKEEKEPVYGDDEKILEIAAKQIDVETLNISNIDTNYVVLSGETDNGCEVEYAVENQKYNGRATDLTIMDIKVSQTTAMAGTDSIENNKIKIKTNGVEGESTGDIASSFNIEVEFDSEENFQNGQVIFYGISDTNLTIKENAQLNYIIKDGDNSSATSSEFWYYGIDGVALEKDDTGMPKTLTVQNNKIQITGLNVTHPGKWLVLYTAEQSPLLDKITQEPIEGKYIYKATRYATYELKAETIKYPVTITVNIISGSGTYWLVTDENDSTTPLRLNSTYKYANIPWDYETEFKIVTDAAFTSATVNNVRQEISNDRKSFTFTPSVNTDIRINF